MSLISQPDFDNARGALSRAFEAIQNRIRDVDNEIGKLKEQRRAFLVKAAETLLPSISSKTLRSLKHLLPGFLTNDVLTAFEQNWTFLGIFRSAAYEQAYTMLQTRLASYLDEVQFGKLKTMDSESAAAMAKLVADKGSLYFQAQKSLELLELVLKAKHIKVTLPAEVTAQIHYIASVGRAGTAPARHIHRPAAPAGATASSNGTVVDPQECSPSNDDSDLWLNFVADIPTSVGTRMMTSIEKHLLAEAELR
jgi:hypothetical protein